MPYDQLRFGLMPVLDAARDLPRTVLPLKSVRYEFVVRGGLAEVRMTQVYCQENAQPLDCEYLFPLPADGAVHRCEATINGRIIRARIEEREAARKLAEEKKAEGRRTALVESERDNLFTLGLGNVQPQDVVEVTLEYLQPLRRQGRQVTLDLPLCPGVRYIPGRALLRSNRGTGVVDDTDQVPDASRITPPRIDGEHPDAAFVELDGQLDAAFLDGEVTSPSHQLNTVGKGDMLRLTLAKGGEVPDRDIALRWQEREPAEPALRGWSSRSDAGHFTLLELRAPACLEATSAVPQDVYFLVDRSGSMDGAKWEKAIDALQACVGVLGPSDRVWVTLFESSYQDFGSEPATPATLLADTRFRELAFLGTAGGTEMGPALGHVLEKMKQFSQDRSVALVLITDAQIGNEREIISLVRAHPGLPVHCFGIDTTLNDSLLLDLVRQQGGTFHALQPHEDVAGRVRQLGRTLAQPVFVNLRTPDGWELAAGAMPNLYAGQIQLVGLRSGEAPKSDRLPIRARDCRNQDVTLEFQLAPVPDESPRLLWCKERLVNLAAIGDTSAAIALSRESNLLCPFTAFVAWDDQEKVAVANHRLIEPVLAPEYAAGPALRAPRMHDPFLDMSAQMRLIPQAQAQPRRAMHKLLDVASVAARIRQLISSTADMPNGKQFAALFQDLLDWLDQSGDRKDATAVNALLDECDRLLEEWHHRQKDLSALVLKLADELELSARMLHRADLFQAGRPSFYDDVRSILSPAVFENLRHQLVAMLSELNRLEDQILKHAKKFVRRRITPLPPPGEPALE